MSNKSTILSTFNDHFMDFVNDIYSIFPDSVDILSAKNSFSLIRKANPKMIIKIWQSYVVEKYGVEIDNGDISFFLNKDYKTDLTKAEHSDKIIEAINRLRSSIQLLNEDNKAKTIKYIQNLKKLSCLYHQ